MDAVVVQPLGYLVESLLPLLPLDVEAETRSLSFSYSSGGGVGLREFGKKVHSTLYSLSRHLTVHLCLYLTVREWGLEEKVPGRQGGVGTSVCQPLTKGAVTLDRLRVTGVEVSVDYSLTTGPHTPSLRL